MTQYVFGTGQLYATPIGGGAPLRFGALQNVSVDMSSDMKELHGQYQFALDVARGKTKVEWKAATANVDVVGFNQIYFGQPTGLSTGQNELLQAFNENGTIPGASTYIVTAANGANFQMDLGAYFAATGAPLKQVASAPTAGQYTVSTTGVYTFNASDANKAVLLNYLYLSTTTGGSLIVTNQLMGVTPRFQLVLSEVYGGNTFTLILYSCVADKLSLALKQDDYMIPDLSGGAFADQANRILRMTTTSIQGGGA